MARWRPPGGSVGDDARRRLDQSVVNGLVIRWMGVIAWLPLGLFLLMSIAPARFASFGPQVAFLPLYLGFLTLVIGGGAAVVIGYLHRRRRDRRWDRDPESPFGDGCPHCGRPAARRRPLLSPHADGLVDG